MQNSLTDAIAMQALKQPGHVPTSLGEVSHPGLDILNEMSSYGAVEELTPAQIAELKRLFEDQTGIGLYCFAYFICGAHDLYYNLHMGICQFLSRWGELKLADGSVVSRAPTSNDKVVDSWRRLHLCLPRDHFKTTLATRANGLRTVTMNPEFTLGIWNENESKSKSWVGASKKVIEESKLYHVMWPEVLPKGVHFREREAGISMRRNNKWGDTGILLLRESHMVAELTIEPFGIGGASAGKHFTHKILDDIIGDRAAESDAVMNDAMEWLNTARALERPAENGCELVNYTRWGYYDTYQHQLTKWKGDYKVYIRHMLEDPDGNPDVVNGEVIFPTRFTTAQAKKMYERDHFHFMSQYMVIPMSGKTISFQPPWIRSVKVEFDNNGDLQVRIPKEHYDPHIMHADLQEYDDEIAPSIVPLAWMDKAILLDPAPTKRNEVRAEPRAKNGIAVVGKDPWNRNFLLEGIGLLEDPVSVLNSIVKLCKKWSITRVGIEEVNFSAIYAPLWSQILYYEHPDLQIEFIEMTPKGMDKHQRITSMIPAFREGFWYINKDSAGHAVQELLEYPNGETKDIIDAMAYTDKYLVRGDTPDELTNRYIQHAYGGQGRSLITGY